MVTDSLSTYTSPAGREFTFAAARFAGINPSSRVLDMGCGYGEAACNLATEFRCRVVAIDGNPENIIFGRRTSEERGVSHLIDFQSADLLAADYTESPFELALAEGGVLSYIGRKRGLVLAREWLLPRGWFAFSDLIIIASSVPEEIRTIYEDPVYRYESEHSYRKLITDEDMEVHFMSLVPPSGWDNYYAHMARHLEDRKGIFSDTRMKMALHREIDVFYRLEAFKYVGYLFCVARKKS